MKPAVAFIVFNRPDVTARVFERIREARPERLFIIADGARVDRPDDVEKCAAVRALTDRIDWPCRVQRNYSEGNLGCRRRVASGLDWVFREVEEAIILEDDCLPDLSFFSFCAELLERHRNDSRVMCISGTNMQSGMVRTPYSYYYSVFPSIWGWATWRRAWEKYDVDMGLWPEAERAGTLQDALPHEACARKWTRRVQRVYDGKVDTWDCQWGFTCLKEGGLTCVPEVNLIDNIGFGSDATHTHGQLPECIVPAGQMGDIVHNPFVLANKAADLHMASAFFGFSEDVSLKRMCGDLARELMTRARGKLSRRRTE